MIGSALRNSTSSKIDILIILNGNNIILTANDTSIDHKAVNYIKNLIPISNFKKRTERHKGSFAISKSADGTSLMQFIFEI